jgi:hypothetical protein
MNRLRVALTDIHNSVRDKTNFKVSATRSALKMLLDSGSPFISNSDRNKQFKSRIILAKTTEEVKKFVETLVTNFDSEFAHELPRNRS